MKTLVTLSFCLLALLGFSQTTDGLLIHYDFHNSVNDQSGNGNNGTPLALSYGEDRFGNTGQAGMFDGDSTVVLLPDSTLWQHDTMTISLWFNTSTHGALLGYQNAPYPSGTNNLVPVGYIDIDGYVRGTLWSSTVTMTDSVIYADSAWHMWTLVHDGVGQRMYIDAQLADTKSGAHNQLSMMNNQLGWALTSGSWASTVNPFYFDGGMDDFRFYDRALNATEIDELFAEADPGSGTGVFEAPAQQALAVWPNPTNGSFSVDVSRLGAGSKTVQVWSATGQLAATQQTTSSIVQMTDEKLVPGLYLVTVNSQSGQATTRIMVK